MVGGLELKLTKSFGSVTSAALNESEIILHWEYR